MQSKSFYTEVAFSGPFWDQRNGNFLPEPIVPRGQACTPCHDIDGESTDKMTIHPATPSDVDTIVAFNSSLSAEIDQETLPLDIVRAGVLAQLKDPRLGHYWLARVHHESVGQLRVWPEFYDWASAPVWWLDNVYVASAYRGMGVFRALFQHMYSLALETGVAKLRLHVAKHNSAAIHVYRAGGFRDTSFMMELDLRQ